MLGGVFLPHVVTRKQPRSSSRVIIGAPFVDRTFGNRSVGSANVAPRLRGFGVDPHRRITGNEREIWQFRLEGRDGCRSGGEGNLILLAPCKPWLGMCPFPQMENGPAVLAKLAGPQISPLVAIIFSRAADGAGRTRRSRQGGGGQLCVAMGDAPQPLRHMGLRYHKYR